MARRLDNACDVRRQAIAGSDHGEDMNESWMQARLMNYVLDSNNHEVAVPNLTALYYWECDLISVTRSGMVHEYEIKISQSDYRADFKKRKHEQMEMEWGMVNRAKLSPNYFWYAIYGFSIPIADIPAKAGLLEINEKGQITIIKNAPRLHSDKLTEKQRYSLARWLSYKLKNCYSQLYPKTL